MSEFSRKDAEHLTKMYEVNRQRDIIDSLFTSIREAATKGSNGVQWYCFKGDASMVQRKLEEGDFSFTRTSEGQQVMFSIKWS